MPKEIPAEVRKRLAAVDGQVLTAEKVRALAFLQKGTRIRSCHLYRQGIIQSVGHNQYQIQFSGVKMVALGFEKCWCDKLLRCEKLCTTSKTILGRAGDRFQAFGATFEILAIGCFPLWAAAKFFYALEGYKSPADFRKYWTRSNPSLRYMRKQSVYVHLFRPIQLPDLG